MVKACGLLTSGILEQLEIINKLKLYPSLTEILKLRNSATGLCCHVLPTINYNIITTPLDKLSELTKNIKHIL